MMHIRFRNTVMTLEEYLSFSKKILIGLGNFHEVFQNVFSWSGSQEHLNIGFNGDFSNFEETIFSQGIGDDEIAYENPDPNNKDLTLKSKSFVDFHNSYSNVATDSNEQFVIRIMAGSSMGNSQGIINIEFPTNNKDAFYQYDFIKCLMEKIIELVNPVYAVITSDKFIDEVEGEGNDFWIGWMTYLASLEIDSYIDNVYEKKVYRNGTWFAISNEVPCSNDKPLIAEAVSIRDYLEKYRLLNYQTYL
ncbi:hypothetical protein D3C76_985740 [compost metagenome]